MRNMDMIMILLVPTVVLVTAAAFYLYSSVLRLLAKTAVRHKVVLITDSLSALGNECAKVFHRGGARLILCGKSWEKLEALAEQLASDSDPTLTFPPKLVLLDFSDMESLADVISEVLECYGCLDALVVNSSTKIKAPVQSLSLHMDRSLMDMNYFGPITLVKGVLPCMISRRTGHILLVSSIQGKLAVPFRTSYAASKHAVQAFFDCLRAEVQEYGISVSTVSHTFISPAPTEDTPAKPQSTWSFSSLQSAPGVAPEEVAGEILKTLSSKRSEVVMAPSVAKAAIYARSLSPNLFFAVVAAGVRNAAAVEEREQ